MGPKDADRRLRQLEEENAWLRTQLQLATGKEPHLNENRLFQILEALPIGIFILDRKGKPRYANRVAEELLGRGIVPGMAKEALAEVYQAFEAGTTDPYPTARMPIVRALSGESSMVTDMEVHAPAEVIPLRVWGTPILDGEGKVLFAVAAFIKASETGA